MKSIILYDFEIQNLLKNGTTQIRRVVKDLPDGYIFSGMLRNSENNIYAGRFWLPGSPLEIGNGIIDIKSPFGAVGEKIWYKETWRERWGMSYANYGCGSAYPVDDIREIEYKDGSCSCFVGVAPLCPDECTAKMSDDWSKWKSPVAMPREASRMTVVPERIWTERVQDISWQGANAEGFDGSSVELPIEQFIGEWDSHAKLGHKWCDNPMVWCAEARVK